MYVLLFFLLTCIACASLSTVRSLSNVKHYILPIFSSGTSVQGDHRVSKIPEVIVARNVSACDNIFKEEYT